MKTRDRSMSAERGAAGGIADEVDDTGRKEGVEDTGDGWQEYNIPAPVAGNEDFEQEWEKLRPLVLKLFRQLHSSSLD